MQKLSLSTAWTETLAFVRGNFGALFTVALAFIALPSVALQVLGPAQQAPAEAAEGGLWMLMLPVLLVLSIAGTLAISALALGRETVVGSAIAFGFRRFLPLLGASLLLMLGALLVMIPLFALLGIDPAALQSPDAGAVGKILLGMLIFLIVFLFLFVRLVLITPVAAAERVGPIAILRRSWELTRGHFWRLLGFFLALLLLLIVASMVVGIVVGLLVALVAGAPEPGSIGGLVMLLASGLLNAAFIVLYTTMLARIYVQLTGDAEAGARVGD